MKSRIFARSCYQAILVGCALVAIQSSLFIASAAAKLSAREHYQAFIEQYCIKCHNLEDWAGSLDLELADLNNVVGEAEIWENVLRKFKGNMMPPQGENKPHPREQAAFMAWLQKTIDEATLANPNPGPSSLHRLNRTEYGNAVRDLLHLQVDISEYLPADDEGYGFDNIADVLRTSPSLLEQYLVASRKISELAIGDMNTMAISKVYKVQPDTPQRLHVPGLPVGTRGGILIEHNFPLDAEYEFNSVLIRNIVGYMTGLEWPHIFEVNIDGHVVFTAQVGGEQDNLASDTNMSEAADAIDERLKFRAPVTAGLHKVVVTFQQKNSAETHEPLELHTRNLDLQDMNGVPQLDYVDIVGPFNATGPGNTASRDRIFSCYPQSAMDQLTCAQEIVENIGMGAFRRPLNDNDRELILGFYQQGQQSGGFEQGIQTALRFILTSPEFLFRSELDPENIAAEEIYPLSDLALASRLSFFLWSSIPDDELLQLASTGTLSQAKVLDQQIERMLKDPKSVALVNNFAAQWLFLRNLQSVYPDTRTFPDFDHKLRDSFRTETSMFIHNIIKNDESILDMLDADYTFVNDRLAQHYNIPHIYGSHFRKVKLDNPYRRGLLGHGSILTITSYPNRTSPVLRGKWVMENIMGTPPPPPPPNVPDLKDNNPSEKQLSMRERLTAHQNNPSCSGCHSVLDPLGFAMENFDGIGRFRERDEAGLVDTKGILADGQEVDGVIGLREVLIQKPEYFVDTFTEKLLTYALGRGLEYYDMPIVRDIRQQAAKEDYRFSAIIKGIVTSTPFKMKRAMMGDERRQTRNVTDLTLTEQ